MKQLLLGAVLVVVTLVIMASCTIGTLQKDLVEESKASTEPPFAMDLDQQLGMGWLIL